MLCLTRRPGDTIRIGNDVVVTILRVKGAQVSVGIEAPHDVNIKRGELEDRDDRRAA